MKYIWPDIANQKAIDFLQKSLENNMLANSYIFSGVSDLGKFSLAKHFAKNIFVKDNPELAGRDNLLEINSDFFLIERLEDKKNISIDQVRELISFLSSSSFLNSYRIVIIKDAQNLNQNSANALLKVLEDFKNKLVVILTVSDLESLPKTILSRSQIINLSPLSFDSLYSLLKNAYKLSPSEAKNIARISLGRPMLAKKFIEEQGFYDSYKNLGGSLIDFLNFNLLDRMKLVDDICRYDLSLGDNLNVIDVWQSLFRDFNFLYHSRPDLVQNEFVLDKMKLVKYENTDFLFKSKEIFQKSNDYLRANISLKSVLEYIAVNI